MNYGNGFFYLAEIGDFRLAQNGCFHLALTWDIDFIFTCVYHDDDIEEDIIFFHDELDRIIDAFIKKYDLQ